jgi:multiple sugar transport system substrate-binding protein
MKLSGVGAIAAGTGGIVGIRVSARAPLMHRPARFTGCGGPISCRPPISCSGTKSSPNAKKALDIKLNVEMINANDIQARITSSVQSGNGPDVIMVVGNWPRL